MRFRELRRVLLQVVLAGLPATQLGCGVLGDCIEDRTHAEEIALPADPPMQFRIDRCAIDFDTCPTVCDLAMERAGLGATASECDVVIEEDRAVIYAQYQVSTGGPSCPVDGRRPAGLERPARFAPTAPTGGAGAWLAQAAWLEAASVYAFTHLAPELEAHGAPRGLVLGAIAAARDEVRHTELMTRLALRYGARPPAPVVARPGPRPLAELAIENAAEGCVRETWGTVMALWQSRTARDPIARATFVEIARDEARHAALAWAIDRWLQPRLDAETAARVAAARAAAAQELLAAHDAPAIPSIGLPHGGELHGLVTRTHHALWSGGAS
jgi:hypothetical protein